MAAYSGTHTKIVRLCGNKRSSYSKESVVMLWPLEG